MTRNPADDVQREASIDRERERQALKDRIDRGEPLWEQHEGAQAVVSAVRDLRFPLDADAIAEQAGDRLVRTSKHREFRVADLLPKLGKDVFTSPGDFETALLRHWEAIEFMELPEDQRPEHGGQQPQQAGDSKRRGVGRE